MVTSGYWFYKKVTDWLGVHASYFCYKDKSEFVQELHTGDFVKFDDETYQILGIIHEVGKECNVYLSEPSVRPIEMVDNRVETVTLLNTVKKTTDNILKVVSQNSEESKPLKLTKRNGRK